MQANDLEQLRWALKASKAMDDTSQQALGDLCRTSGASRGEVALAAMKFGLVVMHSAMDTLVLADVFTRVRKQGNDREEPKTTEEAF